MASQNRQRVTNPVLLVMMEIARQPDKAFTQFGRNMDRLDQRRREARKAIRRLRRAISDVKDSLGDCAKQADWMTGDDAGISVDDVRVCVQEFIEIPNEVVQERLLGTVDKQLLDFVTQKQGAMCPLCGEQHG